MLREGKLTLLFAVLRDSRHLDLIKNLPDTVQVAREYALLGNYETALVYLDGAFAQIQQCLQRHLFFLTRC